MKKKLVFILALVLCIGTINQGKLIAKAEDGDDDTTPTTVTGNTTKTVTSNEDVTSSDVRSDQAITDATDGTNSFSFDTKVKYYGRNSDIVYSMSITVGPMVFAYNYGSQWDPEKHCYVKNEYASNGWADTNTQDDNNRIYVVNNSNYPVKADFSYSHVLNDAGDSNFNAGYGSAMFYSKWNMVNGYFSNSNSWSDVITAISKVGHDENTFTTNTMALKTYSSQSIILDTDTSSISSGTGTGPYWNLKATGTSNSVSMYFNYLGTPDKGMTSTADGSAAGHIILQFYPAYEPSDTTNIEGHNLTD